MDIPSRIKFLVKGSESEPYQVTFWREESNIKSSCTCRAGKARYACKHRFAMLEADVTNLVSGNFEDIGTLQELIQGTDISQAYKPVLEALTAQQLIKSLQPVTPQQKRKAIDVSVAIDIFLQGGFAKGHGGANYFDLYNKDLAYLGSVKTRYSVFNTDVKQLFPTITLNNFVKADGIIHERSQGVYLAAYETKIGMALLIERSLPERLKTLKKALID